MCIHSDPVSKKTFKASVEIKKHPTEDRIAIVMSKQEAEHLTKYLIQARSWGGSDQDRTARVTWEQLNEAGFYRP